MNCKMVGVLFAALLAVTVNAADWGYEGDHGPEHWHEDYPACDDNSQSPIDINNTTADNTLTLTFNNYDQSVSLEGNNNGHTAVFSVSSAPSGNPSITGVGLPTSGGSVFQLAQFHFHWGVDNSEGSEHFLDGEQFPLEVHFVHYNTKYANISEAVDKADGLAVVGFFYEINAQDNTDYDSIINALSSIEDPDDDAVNVNVNLSDLLGYTFNFYRYDGSLTTPPCYESVTWTVCKKPIKISSSQVAAFRALTHDGSHPIGANFRPLQDRNGRAVYARSGNQ